MRLFDPRTPHKSDSNRRIFALYELTYTLVDFMAAFMFIIGSIFFFKEDLVYLGTWMFLIGSFCFALKPTLRLLRELRLLRKGDVAELERRGASEV